MEAENLSLFAVAEGDISGERAQKNRLRKTQSVRIVIRFYLERREAMEEIR